MTDTDQNLASAALVTRRVRAQYEQYPYPTVDIDLAPFIEGRCAEVGFPNQFYHLLWPHRRKREALDILIAGCGTTQAARYAAAHTQARIMAIDFSRNSLDRCRALCAHYGLDNVELRQMSILDLPSLQRDFDYIVCTGVVHHMESPGTGLDALRQVLRPDGSMYLMVYARFGRDAIYLLQDLMRSLAIQADQLNESDIAELIELLDRLPPSHPLHFRRDQFRDLYNTAELIDYLLHVQDQPFTIDQLYGLLQQHGLQVQHLINRAHYLLDALPEGFCQDRLAALDEPRRLAAGELFRGGIHKHEIFCVHSDRPVDDWRISLDHERAGQCIPIPSPSLQTELVRHDHGTCLRAFCTSHQFDDLLFTLNPEQAQVLSAIDGQRSINAIHEHLQHCQRTISHEQLRTHCKWLYERDLIFFRGPQSSAA